MVETYAEAVRADSIADTWPDGREMPPLIRSVANYLAKQEWLSLGATRMFGDRMDDFWIENGADLWAAFGCFMRLPEGSRVAQWFREGDKGEPPIVLIGSEGQTSILAEDLDSFLAAWALAEFDEHGALVAKCNSRSIVVGLPSELIRDEENDEVADGRPAFARFLHSQLGRAPCEVLKPKPEDAPFEQFLKTWGETQRAEISSNPFLKAIATALDSFIPRGEQPWQWVGFRISAIGNRIEIGGMNDPRKLLREDLTEQIRPLVKAERQRRAEGANAVRGLWYTAHLMLYPDGNCQLSADWESPPKFFHGPQTTAAELSEEFKLFPKSNRWKYAWMRELP